MQIFGGYTRCIMVYVQTVNGKLQKWSFFLSFFFFEDVSLRTLHMLGNPNPNPVLNLHLLV